MSGTQNVLDQMTAGIMGKKADKAATLTPVAGEAAPGIPDLIDPFLTNERVVTMAKTLRAEAAVLIKIADGLDAMTGGPYVPPVVKGGEAWAPETKAAEKEADDKAKEYPNYADLQREAQAAAFSGVPAATISEDNDLPIVAEGWACPTHGTANRVNLESKKGRKYMACNKCEEFER